MKDYIFIRPKLNWIVWSQRKSHPSKWR